MPLNWLSSDILELKVNGSLFGQKMINVFHYRLVNLPTDPDYFNTLTAFLSGMSTASFKSTFLACCPSDYTLVNMTAQRVSPERDVYEIQYFLVPGTGAAANPAQDANAVITKQTDHVGQHVAGVITNKGGTGSVHMPGIPSTAGAAGLITAGYSTTLDVFGAAMIAPYSPISGGDWQPCIWHRKDTPQPSSHDLRTFTTQQEIRIMRRRTVGQGI